MVLGHRHYRIREDHTLAAMIDQHNRQRRRHIVTIVGSHRDLQIVDQLCIINQRECGTRYRELSDPRSSMCSLKTLTSYLFGEMRDQETVRTALSARADRPLLGAHSTLHTIDATRHSIALLTSSLFISRSRYGLCWRDRCGGSSRSDCWCDRTARAGSPRWRPWWSQGAYAISSLTPRRRTRSIPPYKRATTTACRHSTRAC